MITNIPTPEDFQNAGTSLLYLAWDMTTDAVRDWEQAVQYYGADADADEAPYWQGAQTALGNATNLTQQAIELGLKGKIAAISPHLLVTRDPKDWPGRVDVEDVDFSRFRTIDASDLVRVHNAFAANRLSDEFKTFWEGVREQRNVLMHSISRAEFKASDQILKVLKAAYFVFGNVKWGPRCLELEASGRLSQISGGEHDVNAVMSQFDIAIRNISRADALRFLGYDKKRRSYLCPHCYQGANRDGDGLPRLAQLEPKTPGSTQLHCLVCDTITIVERKKCDEEDCPGDVFDEQCLTCSF